LGGGAACRAPSVVRAGGADPRAAGSLPGVPQREIEYRRLTPEDVGAAALLIADGFEAYRAFAPAGWEPPGAEDEKRTLQRWAEDPDFWGAVALDSQGVIGHAASVPAARHRSRPVADPGLSHLSYLFVARSHWGSGVATALLRRAIEDATERGFTAMRLFTPAGQARARRFYEREGFLSAGEPMDIGLGLPSLEYHRVLRA